MATAQAARLRNWAKNIVYSTGNVIYPKSVSEIVSGVRAHRHVKALGTGHSFNQIADTVRDDTDTDSLLVHMPKHMNQILDIDRQNMTVTVDAGITYGDLCPQLEVRSFGPDSVTLVVCCDEKEQHSLLSWSMNRQRATTLQLVGWLSAPLKVLALHSLIQNTIVLFPAG